MKKKYLVLPGEVYSLDGQTHFISAYELMRLYVVNPEECFCLRRESDLLGMRKDELLSLEFLRPLSSGKYPIFRHYHAPLSREQKTMALGLYRYGKGSYGGICGKVDS